MAAIAPIAFKFILLAFMVFGLLGLVIPILPGLTIIWVAALAYGLVNGFNLTSGLLFGVMTVLMLFGSVIDNIFMGASAKQTGASWLAIGISLAAGVIGSLILPPFGGLVLALIGLFVVEIIRLRDWRKAADLTKSMAMGCGWAVIIRFGIGVIMIGLWLVWAFLLQQ